MGQGVGIFTHVGQTLASCLRKTKNDLDGPRQNQGRRGKNHQACDLTGFIEVYCAKYGMRKTKSAAKPTAKPARRPVKPTPRTRLQPLATGQVWRMAELNLQVGLVGKLLVHYKLAAPNAVRIANSVSGRATVEKYLKKNKAVLVEA
jgi:hypothetical protein